MTTAAQRAVYQYSYTEPHPSVTKPVPLSTGRGGAGNRTTLCPKTTTAGPTATGPASRSPAASPTLDPRRLSTGRGGTGNVKNKKQVPVLGEPTIYELEREARHDHEEAIKADKRVWHYGRGGEGNMINQTKSGADKGKVAVRSSGIAERRDSNESVISSGSSLADELASREKKTSRAGSFAEKVAAKLGARRGSKGSRLSVEL